MGLLIASFLPHAYDFIIIPAAIILFVFMKFLCRYRLKEIFTVLSVFVIAAGFYRIYDFTVYRKVTAFDGKEISFSGKILEIKEYSGDKSSYLLKGKINGKTSAEMTVYADAADCRINDYFDFSGTVKTFENDYLFNSKDYYKSKGIYLTSDKAEAVKISDNNDFSLMRILSGYREKIIFFIKNNLPEDESAMLCGMLFGDKSGLSDDDKTLFYRTGIGHVMAVSGLHLVLFCGIFSVIFKRLKLRKITTFVLLEIIMLLFAVCSGLSQSVLRAALMMTLAYAAPLFFRRSDTLNSISIAFILLTIPCPFLIRNPSLILSVAGTFSAGVFAPFMTEKLKSCSFIQKQIKNIAYMFFVSIGILPFSVIFFGESSLFSPVANIFLTPVCMTALLFALIACLTVFLNPVFMIKFSGFLCKIVMLCVRFIGKLKFSGMNFGSEMKYAFGGIIIFCIVVFLIFKSRKYGLAAIALSATAAAVCVGIMKFMSADEISIAVLGKDKIDVIIISDDSYTEIVDISGRKNNSSYSLKYLQENNIDKVDGIIMKEKPYQAMSGYNSGFSLIHTGRTILPEGIYVRENMKICGNYPEYSDFENFEIHLENGIINISGSRIFIGYGDFEFVCDSSPSDESVDVYAEYGSIFNPPLCASVIVPEYENAENIENAVTKSNVIIKADMDGKFYLGDL